MQQKRALVTGAARRLGRAMALCLAGRGYDVAVHYSSSQDEAGDVVREIKKLAEKLWLFRPTCRSKNKCSR